MCDTRSYMQRKTNEAKTQQQKQKQKKIENHVADGATHRHHQQIIWINNKIPIIYEFISSWGSFFCFSVAVAVVVLPCFFLSFWLLDPNHKWNEEKFFFNEIEPIIMEENSTDRDYKPKSFKCTEIKSWFTNIKRHL